MHYAELLNGRGLFKYFGGWVAECRPNEKKGIDEFLFRASSAVLALEEINCHERVCLENFRQIKSQLTLKRPRIFLWSPQLFQLFQQFTPFLSCMRFLQNMLLRMVARRLELKTSVPKSLSAAIPRIRSYGFPEKICALVEEYWSRSGESLKDYRDLDQHYFTLCNHVRLQWSPDERLFIFLPDNPGVKAESQLTFAKEINALPYFVSSFNHFHECVERISIEFAFKPKALQEELNTVGMDKLEDGVRQTLALWIDNAITGTALEIGQLEDRRLYFTQRAPTVEKSDGATSPEGMKSRSSLRAPRSSRKNDAKAEKILSELSAGFIDRDDARTQLMELGFGRKAADLSIDAEIGGEDDVIIRE